ncbi:MAG: flagellar biosynthetic protein FliO [Thermoguttaceae bacterium]|nr:flagellar biosynthetic protein FliO [Thermoguttaceae bacterium]
MEQFGPLTPDARTRGPFRLTSAAAVALTVLAALFAFIPSSSGFADDAEPPAAEKTPIDLSNQTPRPAAPAAGRLLLDGAAKLLLVLAAVFALFWLLRRFQTAGRGIPAPGGAFEVLSLIPLSPKNRLALVRFGNRLILLSLAADRTEKVAETSDPDEVARILDAVERKGAEK